MFYVSAKLADTLHNRKYLYKIYYICNINRSKGNKNMIGSLNQEIKYSIL